MFDQYKVYLGFKKKEKKLQNVKLVFGFELCVKGFRIFSVFIIIWQVNYSCEFLIFQVIEKV